MSKEAVFVLMQIEGNLEIIRIQAECVASYAELGDKPETQYLKGRADAWKAAREYVHHAIEQLEEKGRRSR